MVEPWDIVSHMLGWARDNLVEGIQEVMREELLHRDSGSRLMGREDKGKV